MLLSVLHTIKLPRDHKKFKWVFSLVNKCVCLLINIGFFYFFSFASRIETTPGEGNGNPLQYSCLENSMDRGAWQAAVCGVTQLSMHMWGGGGGEGDGLVAVNRGRTEKKNWNY